MRLLDLSSCESYSLPHLTPHEVFVEHHTSQMILGRLLPILQVILIPVLYIFLKKQDPHHDNFVFTGFLRKKALLIYGLQLQLSWIRFNKSLPLANINQLIWRNYLCFSVFTNHFFKVNITTIVVEVIRLVIYIDDVSETHSATFPAMSYTP